MPTLALRFVFLTRACCGQVGFISARVPCRGLSLLLQSVEVSNLRALRDSELSSLKEHFSLEISTLQKYGARLEGLFGGTGWDGWWVAAGGGGGWRGFSQHAPLVRFVGEVCGQRLPLGLLTQGTLLLGL